MDEDDWIDVILDASFASKQDDNPLTEEVLININMDENVSNTKVLNQSNTHKKGKHKRVNHKKANHKK
jgi:hypothetical protein